jgi:hypothetical protein
MKFILTNIGKKQIIQWNEKTIQFWKDAYEDLTSKKDKD